MDFVLPADMSWKVYHIPKPKKHGEYRKITVPNDALKAVQRKMLEFLYTVRSLRPTAFAHGFVPGRNTVTGVSRHYRLAEFLICMDIKDFFDNFPVDVVKDSLIKAGVGRIAAEQIMTACTYNNTIPQGGPCSPYLTNIGMHDMDCMLSAYAKSAGLTYSRYADDITMAAMKGTQLDMDKVYSTVVRDVSSMLYRYLGLRLNKAKSHRLVMRSRTGRTVNGVVIRQDGLGYNAPRKMRYLARAMNCRLYWKLKSGQPCSELRNEWAKLRGYVCYMDSIRAYGDREVAGADPVIQEKYFEYNQRRMSEDGR